MEMENDERDERRNLPGRPEIEVGRDGRVFRDGKELPVEYSKTGVSASVRLFVDGRFVEKSIPSLLKEAFLPESVGKAKYKAFRPVSLGLDNVVVITPKERPPSPSASSAPSGIFRFDGLVDFLRILKDDLDSIASASEAEAAVVRDRVHNAVDRWFDMLAKDRRPESPFWARMRKANERKKD